MQKKVRQQPTKNPHGVKWIAIAATFLLLGGYFLLDSQGHDPAPIESTPQQKTTSSERAQDRTVASVPRNRSRLNDEKSAKWVPIPPILAELKVPDKETRLIVEAEEKMIASCMANKGLMYKPEPYESLDEESIAKRRDPANLEYAEENGYGIANSIVKGPTEKPTTANDELLKSMSKEQLQKWYEVLSGPDLNPSSEQQETDPNIGVASGPGGTMKWHRNSCLAEASRKVFGDDVMHSEAILQKNWLRNEIIRRMREDSSYVEALRAWRVCMEGQGYPYEAPGKASKDLSKKYHDGELDIGKLRSQEIQVATADANCYRKVDFPRIRAEAQMRIEQQIKGEEETTIAALKAMHEETVKRAGKLL